VLDLGCGPGRHLVPLALKGFHVTGVDASSFLLGRAQAYAQSSQAEVEFVHDDMRAFRRPGGFDLAISMFNSFGYFTDRADDRRVVTNLYDSLRSGGVGVIEVFGKELTAGRYVNVTESEGVTRVEEHQIVENWTRVKSLWLLISSDSIQRFEFAVRVYSGLELSDLLRDVGFAEVALYGDLDGRPYGPGATRLIAVARKT
jgi:SAM-dependent methyltransferase